MRVVVAGLAKSGTTALAYAVKGAMPADTDLIFEPQRHVDVRASNALCKVLLHPLQPITREFYEQFERMILLVRDPRDLLVSRVLYRVFDNRVLNSDAAKLQQYLDLLQAKEASPRSVSMMKINAVYRDLVGAEAERRDEATRWRWILDHALKFHDGFPNCLAFKYELLVERRFESVATFLALPTSAFVPDVPEDLRRVVRTRRSGNWRHWFCSEDVGYYRPLMCEYMQRYGYEDDWQLSASPAIRTEECSGYVLRLVRERRESGIPAAH